MRVLRAWERPRAMPGFRSKTVHAAAKAMGPPIAACVAHRCQKHENVKPLNVNTDEQTECGACIAEDTTSLLTLYNDMRDRLDRACGALELLSPGAGEPFRPPPIEDTDVEGTAEDNSPEEEPPVPVDGSGETGKGD